MADKKKINDSWTPKSYLIPAPWLYTELDIVFENLPLTDKKLVQKNYEISGEFPVVDQGASKIGGHSNDKSKLIELDRPAIVFGDHTKCLKYINFSFVPGADGIKVLVPKSPIDPKYAFYACKSLRLPDRGYSRHYSFLKKCEFPLAPLNEQKRIVAKIEELFSELDNGIAALKTARKQLNVYRQAVLKHAFEGKLTAKWREENADKLETPEQLLARIQQERDARYQQQLEEWKAAVKMWEVSGKEGKKPSKPSKHRNPVTIKENDFYLPTEWSIAELADIAGESILGKMLDKQKNIGIERLYLGNINVRWGKFELSELKTMKIEESEIERYSLKLGDLVICEGGEPGRCAVWQDSEFQIFIQKALHRVRFTSSYSPKFAFYYLIYAAPLERVVKHFTGTTIKHLTGAGLGKIQLPVCAYKEQMKIIEVIESKLSEIDKFNLEISMQIEKAEVLRQSILKKAFSGQLVAQDPNDEPASELLARIKAEKTDQAKRKATKRSTLDFELETT